MTDYTDPIFRKLDRIPGAPNFVRYNFEELVKTLKAYVAFAKGMPTISYAAGIVLIKDLVVGLSSIEQARQAARRLPESPSRQAIIDFVDAFCLYAVERNYKATLAYADFSTHFRISRDLYVPVKPTLVARENGQLKPIFVFGWKSIPLTLFQRRLLMTILEDAMFSLTDFADADAEIVFFPEVNGAREPEIWHRGDYNVLSDTELKNQMEVFISARSAAYPIIDQWLSDKRRPAQQQPKDDPSQPGFDFPNDPRPGV